MKLKKKHIGGVYKIQSKLYPDRIYIGSAVNFDNRWYRHLYNLKKDKHDNPILQHHYNKHGKDDLVFSILLVCNKDELVQWEQYYLDNTITYFNVLKNAYSSLGFKHSEKTLRKLSEISKGIKRHPLSRETKDKISKSQKGKIVIQSPETRAKISKSHTGKPKLWLRGRKRSAESVKKGADKIRGKPSPKKGKHISEKTRMKLIEFYRTHDNPRKGKKATKETIDRLRAAHIGQTAWNKGKPHTEEHKEKLRLAWIKRKEKRLQKQLKESA